MILLVVFYFVKITSEDNYLPANSRGDERNIHRCNSGQFIEDTVTSVSQRERKNRKSEWSRIRTRSKSRSSTVLTQLHIVQRQVVSSV